MKKFAGLLVVAGVLAGSLASCGATPVPTEPPPTQTPWIIVVTATPGTEGEVAEQPSKVPGVVTETPSPTRKVVPTPTKRATVRPGSTAEPTSTASLAPTRVRPTPTGTPDADSLKYPPPALVDPPDGRSVGWRGTITLVWQSVGELTADEYYHVHLDRPPQTEGEQWYGDYVFSKDTTLLLEQSFLAPFHLGAEYGSAVVYWWVRVVRKTGEDANGKPLGIDIGLPSERRFFIVEPRPGG